MGDAMKERVARYSFSMKRLMIVVLVLTAILLASVAVGLLSGPTAVSPFAAFSHPESTEAVILWQVRLPRVLLALFVGMALASSGSAFQALLRNPLADPFILGVSGGAALGNVIATSLGSPFWLASLAAFLSAVLSMLMIYAIAKENGRLSTPTLLLTGVIFNAFSFSIIMFVFNFLAPRESHQVLFLLIGSLDAENLETVAIVGGSVLLAWILLIRLSYPLNLLLFGEEAASSMGLNVERYRKWVFFTASLAVGAVVSVSGLIGFVGLFIPHMLRLVIGADHRLLIPATGLAGASFLILADSLARSVLSHEALQTQLPVGVITALIGAPFFVFLLKRKRREL